MSKLVVIQEAIEGNSRITETILGFIGDIPESNIRKSKTPIADSRKLTKTAALKSSVTAGALALPPGPFSRSLSGNLVLSNVVMPLRPIQWICT